MRERERERERDTVTEDVCYCKTFRGERDAASKDVCCYWTICGEREIVHEKEREMQLLKMCVVAGLHVEREQERERET